MINNYNKEIIEKNGRKILKKYENKILNSNRKEYLCISMFPYPSGKLHLGHFRNYTLNDFICRYKIIKKKKSFIYFGWDSFGLPAENAAIKKKIIPKKWVKKNILYMKKQLKKMSLFVIWEKEINTSNKSYYLNNQKIFINFLYKKFIYRKKEWVNWDPKDKTVLADEQVIKGRGWRSNEIIIKKKIFMYFIKIKKIINLLYTKTFKLKWPLKVINSQKRWINKKKYYCFILYIKKQKIKVYSLNIFDFLNTNIILIPFYFEKINFFLKKKSIKNNLKNFLKKKSFNTKIKAFFYINNKKIFYKIYFFKYCINKFYFPKNNFFYKKKINRKFIKKNLLNSIKYIFHLKDWSISRQRKWGTKIPLFYCFGCKILKTKKICVCKKYMKKEKDTLDTFFDSSWYFLKYFYKNPFKEKNINKKIDLYIGGIEHSVLHLLYVRIFFIYLNKLKITKFKNPFKKLLIHGLILNKSFFLKKKSKYLKISKLKSKSVKIKIEKMSKSKKNGVNPLKLIKKYGSDTLRMFIFFLNEPKKNIIWEEKKIKGCYRFINKIWIFFVNINYKNLKNFCKKNFFKIYYKKIFSSYKKKKTNNIVSSLMIFFNEIKKNFENNFLNINFSKAIRDFLIFLHPICPLVTSVIWETTGINKKFGNIYNNNPFND
ncbi:class I tRNA ligase family protein [Candidatus Vidania fulgoroideorum]